MGGNRLLDSPLWIPDSRYWILDSLSVQLGNWIPVLSEIPLYSGFQSP